MLKFWGCGWRLLAGKFLGKRGLEHFGKAMTNMLRHNQGASQQMEGAIELHPKFLTDWIRVHFFHPIKQMDRWKIFCSSLARKWQVRILYRCISLWQLVSKNSLFTMGDLDWSHSGSYCGHRSDQPKGDITQDRRNWSILSWTDSILATPWSSKSLQS